MRKLLIGLFFLGVYAGIADARGREGYLIKGTYSDTGDIIETVTVSVGTTTPVQIFFSTATQARNFREIMFQNTSTGTFRIYIGTHSAVSATSGGRFFIPAGASWTTHAYDDLWGISEAAVLGSLEILGQFERDSKDASITDR